MTDYEQDLLDRHAAALREMHELDLRITRSFAEHGAPAQDLMKAQDHAAARLAKVQEELEGHKQAIREGRA